MRGKGRCVLASTRNRPGCGRPRPQEAGFLPQQRRGRPGSSCPAQGAPAHRSCRDLTPVPRPPSCPCSGLERLPWSRPGGGCGLPGAWRPRMGTGDKVSAQNATVCPAHGLRVVVLHRTQASSALSTHQGLGTGTMVALSQAFLRSAAPHAAGTGVATGGSEARPGGWPHTTHTQLSPVSPAQGQGHVTWRASPGPVLKCPQGSPGLAARKGGPRAVTGKGSPGAAEGPVLT